MVYLIHRYMVQTPYTNTYDPATLVIVLPIHKRGSDDYRCGEMSVSSMLTALSILYTLQNTNLVSNLYRFNLRAVILDNCENILRIDQDLMSLLNKGSLCNEPFDSLGSRIDLATVMGVQTTSSRYVVAANRVTSPLKVQLMSSSASSTALSDQLRYPFFARTVPPDNVQMDVIAKILKTNDWSYVGIIYTLESYGVNGYRTLQNIVNSKALSCIGVAQGIDYRATVADVRPAIRNIANTEGIGVIILIVTNPRTVLDAIIAEGVANRFVVIGTDAWADDLDVIRGVSSQFAGAITVGFRDGLYLPFATYLRQLSSSRMGLPNDWYEEFYQHIHECHLQTAAKPLTQYTTICAPDLLISVDQIKKHGVGIRAIMATTALANGLSAFASTYACASLTFSQCIAKVTNGREALFNSTLRQTKELNPADFDPFADFNLELGYDDRYWDIGYNIYSVRNAGVYNKVNCFLNNSMSHFSKVAIV